VNRLNLGKLIAVLAKTRPGIEAFAHARTGCRATAEDLMQDSWVKIENATVDGAIENPAGFITKVVKTTVAGHIRKERRRAEIDAEVSDLLWDDADEISPERILIGRENLAAAHTVLNGLPERTRRIFLMNRIERKSHRLIAEELGVSEETVYYHIRRALERLAKLRDELAD
jgi:RNA polymerase sigma factor (sigma-70 family)